ncbi:MAG: response regulator, partial [Rhodospirillales bacterium]|nr:response regulator [Rhodospirillales bacterium]
RLPVIALSAEARDEAAADCRLAGIDNWLVKPVSRAALGRAIDAALVGRYSQGGPPPFALPPDSLPVLDTRILLEEVLSGQSALLGSMLQDFAATTRGDVRALLAAWKEGRAADARRASHAVKGAARMAGALRLAGLAQAFEEALKSHRDAETATHAAAIEAAFEDVVVAIAALASGNGQANGTTR